MIGVVTGIAVDLVLLHARELPWVGVQKAIAVVLASAAVWSGGGWVSGALFANLSWAAILPWYFRGLLVGFGLVVAYPLTGMVVTVGSVWTVNKPKGTDGKPNG
jgi:hypothetical protein